VSRSKDSAREQWSEDSNARYAELQQMIAGGRSFSGNERHCAFLNTGSAGVKNRFANVSGLSGIDLPDDGRALALSDWDSDGDVDLWISNRTGPQLRLMRNNTDDAGHSVSIRLIGNGTTVNRDAIGARIALNSAAGGKSLPQTRTIRAGEGFLSQSSAWQHFGLAGRDTPISLTITWPDASQQNFQLLPVNQRYSITQGNDTAVPEESTKRAITSNALVSTKPDANARIFLRSPVPLPKAGFETFDGRKILLPSGDGKPFLVSFWASWCAPCLAELEDLHQRQPDLETAGLRVIALSVNGLGADTSKPMQAFDLAQKYGDRLAFGLATEGLVGDFQFLTDLAVSVPRDIPLPSSFLVDGAGRLVAIYKGRVDPDQLLADLTKANLPEAEHFEAAALVPGTAIQLPEVRRKSTRASARILTQLAKTALRSNQPDKAADYYREALRVDPSNAESYVQLASLSKSRGDRKTALGQLQNAVRIHPRYAEAHRRLGELHSELQQTSESIKHYRSAIDIYPGDVSSLNNLAWILATTEKNELRDAIIAQEFATQAIAVAGERADLLDTLAAAQAEAGDIAQAIETARRAIKLARESNQSAVAAAIEKSLAKYQTALEKD